MTSGARDANLPAVDCAMGAGCILTWQEDPEGLRPGQGLGPGEGWSGAIANQKTDIWYSYISYGDFDKVFAAEDTIGAITMNDYALLTDATMPKPYVPMAAPIRLTDNNMCKSTNSDPYCYIDFNDIDAIDPENLPTAPTTDSDFCATVEPWDNPGGTTLNLCVTEDDRRLNGRVAATRVRLNLKPYTPADSGTNDNGTPDDPSDDFVEKSAWVVMAAEETKALGDELIEEDPIDIGKDVWYYSFDPFRDHFMVAQGGILNQPAQCNYDLGEDDPLCLGLEEGTPYPVQVDDRDNEYYLTEIARRFALTTNSVQSAIDSESGLSAMLIYKQGIINQGGPADIFLRRVLYEPTYDPIETDHPIVNVDIPITTTTTSDPITLPDENLFPADVYYDVDGYVYEDNDEDGSYNPGEGIAGVTLHLFIDVDSDGVVDLNIDLDGDGDMINEDIDGDGYQDVAEDLDGDGNLDVAEDTNSNGILDDGEDIDGDGFLDLYDEDIDGDGHLDVEEPDTNGDGNFDLIEYGDFSILTISGTDGYYLFKDVPQDYAFAIAVVDPVYQAVNGRPTIVGELVVENPYAFENMDCDEWAYADGSNPNYLQGVCLSPAINLSGTTIVTCDGASGNNACADLFPMNDDGSNTSGGDLPQSL